MSEKVYRQRERLRRGLVNMDPPQVLQWGMGIPVRQL